MIRTPAYVALLFAAALPVLAQPAVQDADLPFKEGANGEKLPLFMHEQSMSGSSTGWARDDLELEAVFTVTCLTPEQTVDLVMQNNQRLYRRARRSPLMEAFSVGYPVDEIPWDGDSHAVREGRIPFEGGGAGVEPYVWLQIESGRFEVDPEEDGKRRLSLGTDLMDDIYYDTKDFLCLGQELTIRARKRWDNETTLRRLLVAIKQDSGVDEFGMKSPAKVDVRTDSATSEQIDGLDEAVMRGRASWGGDAAVVPLRRAWLMLRDRGLLPSSPTYKHVLALEPKAFVRSVRSRYHLNEVRLNDLQSWYGRGKTRLEAIVAMAREARQQNAVPANHLAAVQAFEDKVRRVLDGSLLLERTSTALQELGLTADLAAIQSRLPGTAGAGASTSIDDVVAREPLLKQRKVVADAVCALYHELARDLDDGSSESLRRVICRALDRELEDHVEWYEEWRVSQDQALRVFTTHDRFVELHAAQVGDAQALAAYNAHGQAQAQSDNDWEDFQPLDQASFDALRFQLRNEQVRDWIRQIEAAGSAAKGLWFDEAREFYVPESNRAWGNFLIDTFDFSRMYSADVWDGIPIPERRPSFNLNQAPYSSKLIGSTVVDELQIELDAGTSYYNRLKQLRSIIGLPRHFMRWATATNQATDPAGYAALFEQLKALGDEELQAKLAPFEDYLKAQGSAARNFSASEFRTWLDPARLTAQIRDDASYTEPAIETALAGARFVFEQYRNAMIFVGRLKEERVLGEFRRAGAPNCMRWEPATASKGDQALRALRAQAGGGSTGGSGGGFVGLISGNTSRETAAEVERKDYPGQKLEAGASGWFKLTLEPNQTATFTITFQHAQGDLDMALHRSNGQRVAPPSEGTTDQEEITYTAGPQGITVYLRVYGYDGVAGNYDLKVR